VNGQGDKSLTQVFSDEDLLRFKVNCFFLSIFCDWGVAPPWLSSKTTYFYIDSKFSGGREKVRPN
jgi:hypothetical protein